ncbi:Planctomycete cytochrome C [Neorhodopirellula lusitana]|uniref:Planctomycete cytochrome C n=1 Tax=Neorhodopirellula lusitana TaxID=445327 RepID=A0ABY1QID8_9BACT|nr:DUF1592 domain-containing protein [Neorhodopirellula lusitana]SMP68982.1 Planctomycete cytochrome C [Neorhodopirellula lusitana]
MKIVPFYALFCLWLCSDGLAQERAQMPESHLAVFKQYCFDCHDADTQEGKLDLETLSFEISTDLATAEQWDDILAALNSAEMPPEGEEQIPDEQKAALLSDLAEQMVLARNILSDSGGEITMRRLNRREYQNALERLLGFRPDVSTLPADDETGGFDTAGGSLFFSSDQFEQYRETATKALEYTLSTNPRPEPKTVRFEGETISQAYREKAIERQADLERAKAYLAQDAKPPTDFGFPIDAKARKVLSDSKYALAVYDRYFLSRPESETGAILLPGRHNGPVKRMPRINISTWYPGGTYKVRIKAASYQEDAEAFERYIQVHFSSGKNSFTSLDGLAKVTGTIDNPQLIELQLENPAGVKGAFSVKQRNYETPWPYRVDMMWKAKNGVGRLPAVWVDYVEVEGPFFEERLDYLPRLVTKTAGQSDVDYARSVITKFATVAFRSRDPNPEYVDNLVRHYQGLRDSGDDSRKAMIDCLALVLSSPSFVYLSEPRGEHDGPVQLSDRELAIRLANFLTSSPPDPTLLAAAGDGSLANPEVLRSQTERLLRDSRFDRFVSGFAHQWLDMKRLDMFEYSALEHPEFDNAVRHSARQEVYQTIRHITDANLPIDTLLKADFVIINDVLGDFYHLPGVVGSHFRRVSLPPDSPRGGLLGAAAVHVMGADGHRSSPVERGVWVLRNLLSDPPPPAPPNIPMLQHEDAALSIRDLQKRHQAEPQCASCHRKIDPIGYGLENFSAAGQWRDFEEVKIPEVDGAKKKRKKTQSAMKQFPIDPSGVLPGGETFATYHQLRDHVHGHYRDAFARGFAENLIAYGLGRPFSISDHNLATQVTTTAAKNGNTVAAFVHALVQSTPFQMK